MSLTGRIRVWPKAVAANYARMRMLGGAPVVMCKSDAPCLTMSLNNSSILAINPHQFLYPFGRKGTKMKSSLGAKSW